MPLVALDRRDVGPALDLARFGRRICATEGRFERTAGWAFADPVEVRQEAVDRVGEGDRIGVEDDHVLGSRIGDLQRFAERAAFVALAARAVKDLELRPPQPPLEDLHGLVVGVVDQDHLVGGVFELIERLEQPFDDALLVISGDVH